MEAEATTIMTAKLPILNPGELIKNGNKVLKKTVGTSEETYEPTSIEEKLDKRNEMKAKGTLLMALPNKDQLKFHSYQDAKLLLEAIEKRLQRLISQLEIQGEVIQQEDMNLKLLRSLLSEWKTHALIWRNKAELETISLNDLYNNLNIYELELSGLSNTNQNLQNMAFVFSNSTSSTYEADTTASGVSASHTQEDLEQIDNDDLEEMDLHCEMAMLTIRSRRFKKRTGMNLDMNGRRIGFDKSKVECFNCHKNGHFARECRAPKNQDNGGREYGRKTVPVESPTENALIAQDRVRGVYVDVISNIAPSDVKTVKTIVVNHKGVFSTEEPKPIMKNNFSPPIIEDWHSDDESKINNVGASVNTAARPVNTAGSKSTVNHQRLKSKAYKRRHSQDTRPNNKFSANKNSIFNKKFNTIRVNDSTARDRAVVSGSMRREQKEYKEKGVIDSGCYRHMTENKCYLIDFEAYYGGFVTFGDGKCRISGKGKIKTGKSDFDDVYFCKELKYNVFSVSQMCDKKNNVLFSDTECLVLSSNFKLLDKSQVLLRVPRKDNIYSVDLKSVVPTGEAVNTSCYVLKRALVTKPHKKTPYELIRGSPPLIYFMKPFGCFVTILNIRDNLGKFEGKADEGYFVGYLVDSTVDAGKKAPKVDNSEASDNSEKNDQVLRSEVKGLLQQARQSEMVRKRIERISKATTKVKKVNDKDRIQALVDKTKEIITEDSVRSYLHFDDAEGTAYLLKSEIFEGLARMGAKTTAWNEFSSTMASIIICLADNKKFNFSKRKQRKEVEISHDESEDEDHVCTPYSDPLPSGRRVKSPMEKDGLGAQDDASKQGKIIEEIDQNAQIALDDETQGRTNDDEMFGVDDLAGKEVVMETTTGVKIVLFQQQILRIYEAEVKHSSSPGNPTQNIDFVSSSNTNSTTDSVSAATSVFVVCAQLYVSSHPNIDSLSNAVIFSFFSSQSTSPQLDNDGLKQIDVDDLEEMDLRWQMAMLTVRARRFLQKTGRNLGDNRVTTMGFDMSKVECYNCHRKGHFAQECYYSESDSESLSLSSLSDRIQLSGEYHVVPPPITGNFMPPKPDLVFYTSPIAVETAHSAFNVQLSPAKPAQDISHTTRPMAPIIEDWPVEAPILEATPKPTSSNTNGSSKRKNRKTYFLCRSVDHLIKDCNFHKTSPTPRNYAHRGYNKQYALFTKNHPQKHIVPTAVLTKSKPVSVTDVRPVSVVVPNIMVSRPRHAHSLNTRSNSTIRRHKARSQSSKTSNSSPNVSAAKAQVVSAAKGKRGNPQYALKDKGVIDTGCSWHMIGNMSYLSDFQELNGGYVAFGGNPKGGKFLGKGKIKTDFKLPDESQVLLRVPRENNMYNFNLKDNVPSGDLTCLFAKATIDESNLWHRRLRHINFKTINKLVKGPLSKMALLRGRIGPLLRLPELCWQSHYYPFHFRLRLQALIDKKKVVVTEAAIRDALHLDDAEGVDCLPNEEIFTALARMGYEKPSTKLTFYKAFFSSQWKFLIHMILQSMIAKRTSWNEFSSAMASAVIYLSTGRKFNFSKVGKGCSGVKTPLFEGMLVARELEEQGDAKEQGDAEEQSNDDNAAEEPVIAVDDVAQYLEIIKLKTRVKKLEKTNKVKTLKLRRLRKVGTFQRVDTSDDTLIEDVSTQGRIIDELDRDEGSMLMNEQEETEEVRDNADDAQVEGRQADDVQVEARQAEIYQINMDHAAKVLSMEEDEQEVQEVVEVVTTAKLITEVVAAVSETVSAADAVQAAVPAAIMTPAPVKAIVPSTKRKRGVVIWDLEEESSAKTPTETKSKDKGKGITVEEPKPIKKKQQVKLDEAYARKLHEELNQDID
uniref:Ribonuclease H-like domain-containing protein n=1 Tax=Tanacetum cinerariifolium TaxID=118510 RepID=A0A6L2JTF7_TANCI|nr:ribonuclease H-like domain-containing protein [Tanacetum cinerariifolium]